MKLGKCLGANKKAPKDDDARHLGAQKAGTVLL
jgi:hypothetical protein